MLGLPMGVAVLRSGAGNAGSGKLCALEWLVTSNLYNIGTSSTRSREFCYDRFVLHYC